jgi:hypothetical protein
MDPDERLSRAKATVPDSEIIADDSALGGVS